MHAMNKARFQKIMEEKTEMEKTLEVLRKTEVKDMWKRELEIFEKEYQKYKKERELISNVVLLKTVTKKRKT